MHSKNVVKSRGYPFPDVLEGPLQGQKGYGEETMESGELAVEEMPNGGENGTEERDEVQIWEVTSTGKEIPYVPDSAGGYTRGA